ncbi:MAG: UDP-glucose 4-epimerase GalE [Erysipelotrichaceae bacterium]|jgi:UDP-glucose 4-epimerase|nr:UDP-glucose 4-epimerase GalE [Erysipelotrichaceae bacterium]
MAVLVTGGLGFIGSHAVVELLQEGLDVVIVDDLSNSSKEVLSRIAKITGIKPFFYPFNVCKLNKLKEVFEKHIISEIIHFAGFKAVGESSSKPLEYYDNNLNSTLALLKMMEKYQVKKMIFSSSATVYGERDDLPFNEGMTITHATNPYGETKIMNEIILRDVAISRPDYAITVLRYANPIGAHSSGLIGEKPSDIPNNLLPYIQRVASKKLNELAVFGDDYPTTDGTGVRDYIHVTDLAKGHVLALKKMVARTGFHVYNLGTGRGTSVLELVAAFERENHVKIPYRIAARRSGDIATSYLDVTLAKNELGFQTKLTINDAVRDAYRFEIRGSKLDKTKLLKKESIKK